MCVIYSLNFNPKSLKGNRIMITTLYDVKNYINSESFNAIELERILAENDWFAGSSDGNFGTDGYDKLVMTEDGTVDMVKITPSNLDRSDIQAYIRNEINQGNSICIDDEGNGAAGIGLIEPRNGEAVIEDLNSYSEPVAIDQNKITESFREHIIEGMGSMEDVYIFKLTKGEYSLLVALYLH